MQGINPVRTYVHAYILRSPYEVCTYLHTHVRIMPRQFLTMSPTSEDRLRESGKCSGDARKFIPFQHSLSAVFGRSLARACCLSSHSFGGRLGCEMQRLFVCLCQKNFLGPSETCPAPTNITHVLSYQQDQLFCHATATVHRQHGTHDLRSVKSFETFAETARPFMNISFRPPIPLWPDRLFCKRPRGRGHGTH